MELGKQILGAMCYKLADLHRRAVANKIVSLHEEIMNKKNKGQFDNELKVLEIKYKLLCNKIVEMCKIDLGNFCQSAEDGKIDNKSISNLLSAHEISSYEYNEVIYQVMINIVKGNLSEEEWKMLPFSSLENEKPIHEFVIADSTRKLNLYTVDVHFKESKPMPEFGYDREDLLAMVRYLGNSMISEEKIRKENKKIGKYNTRINAQILVFEFARLVKPYDNQSIINQDGYAKSLY